MSPPSLLLVHENDDLRARAAASFHGLPVQLLCAREPAEAAQRLEPSTRLVVADVAKARWAAEMVDGLRQAGERLPALALFCSFEAEPQAFQSGAVALVTHPLAPAEAQALASLCASSGGLTRLAEAAGAERRHEPGGRTMQLLTELVAKESGAVLAWAQYHAAVQLLSEGRLQEALEDLSALVEEQPTFWRAHERLASVWDVAGDPEGAVRHRDEARALRERLARDSDAALAAHPEAVEAARRPDAAPPAQASAEPAAAEADVIVADDSELVREMLADVLQRAGFSVRTASNGIEALDLAKARRPDIMILDGLMPGKTGFDACKEVKETLFPSRPPKVLIFSAIYTKQRQRSEATALYKVDEVLAKPTDKPLDEAELLSAVRRHLAR